MHQDSAHKLRNVEPPPIPARTAQRNISNGLNKPLIAGFGFILLALLLIIVLLLVKLSSRQSDRKIETAPVVQTKSSEAEPIAHTDSVQKKENGTTIADAKDNKPILKEKKESTTAKTGDSASSEIQSDDSEQVEHAKDKANKSEDDSSKSQEKEPPPALPLDMDAILTDKIIERSNFDKTAVERGKNMTVEIIGVEINDLLKQSVDAKFTDSNLDRIKKEAETKFSTADLVPPDDKFPKKMLDKVTAEADDKYKLINIGDRVSFGSGSKKYEGIYQGYNGSYKISVGFRNVPLTDVPEEIVSRLSKSGVEKLKKIYLDEKYNFPKRKYENERKEKLASAEENRSKHVSDCFFIPKQAFMVSERKRISSERFTYYGFKFNDFSGKWEKMDEFISNSLSSIKESKSKIRDLEFKRDELQNEIETEKELLATEESSFSKIKSGIKNSKEFVFEGYYISKLDDGIYKVAEKVKNGYYGEMSDNHIFLVTSKNISYSYYPFSIKVLKYEFKDGTGRQSKTVEGLFDAEDYSAISAELKEMKKTITAKIKHFKELDAEIVRIRKLFETFGVIP